MGNGLLVEVGREMPDKSIKGSYAMRLHFSLHLDVTYQPAEAKREIFIHQERI